MKRLAFVAAAITCLTLAASASAGASSGQSGRLSIPRLGIYKMPIYASPALINDGPFWHYKHGARPGQGEVMVIGGHDVTSVPGYGAHGPFYNLVTVRRGDLVTIWYNGVKHEYRFRSRPRWHRGRTFDIPVRPGVEAVWFYCCWPRYTAEGRLWVEADAVKQKHARGP